MCLHRASACKMCVLDDGCVCVCGILLHVSCMSSRWVCMRLCRTFACKLCAFMVSMYVPALCFCVYLYDGWVRVCIMLLRVSS